MRRPDKNEQYGCAHIADPTGGPGGVAVGAGRSTLTARAGSVRSRASRRAIRASARPGGSEPGTGAPAGDAHTGASATADTMPKPPYSTLYYRASDIYRVHHLSPNTA